MKKIELCDVKFHEVSILIIKYLIGVMFEDSFVYIVKSKKATGCTGMSSATVTG